MYRLPLLFLLWLVVSLPLFAQKNTLLKEWQGVWKGNLEIWSTKTEKPQIVPMELHILPTDSAQKFIWKIVYNQEPRNYILYAQNPEKGIFLLDEQNGIKMEMKLWQNLFVSTFEVENNLLVGTYRLQKKEIWFEILFYPKSNAQKTGNLPEQKIPEVVFYPSQVLQRAVLKKK